MASVLAICQLALKIGKAEKPPHFHISILFLPLHTSHDSDVFGEESYAIFCFLKLVTHTFWQRDSCPVKTKSSQAQAGVSQPYSSGKRVGTARGKFRFLYYLYIAGLQHKASLLPLSSRAE